MAQVVCAFLAVGGVDEESFAGRERFATPLPVRAWMARTGSRCSPVTWIYFGHGCPTVQRSAINPETGIEGSRM